MEEAFQELEAMDDYKEIVSFGHSDTAGQLHMRIHSMHNTHKDPRPTESQHRVGVG